MTRIVTFLLLLASISPAITAQTPAQRYHTAKKIWLAHRADGMTFDDDTPAAAAVIDAMWEAVVDAANSYLIAHPAATPKQIEGALIAVDPMTDPRFGAPLTARVLRLEPNLFAISLSDYTASTVFVLRPKRDKPEVWSIDRAGEQPKDLRGLLKAWQSSRASGACRDRQSKTEYGTCGPLSGMVGPLPAEASGSPRFYIDADYSKDMGAQINKQTSVWRWNGDHAELLWIRLYDFSIDDNTGVHYRDGILSIIEKRFPRTFSSCNGCFEPTTEQRLRITSSSIDDLGERPRIPELDLIDELFWRIAHKLPTTSIAAPEVAAALQEPILAITSQAKPDDPLPYYLGMLMDWSVLPTLGGSQVCISVDGLDRFNFTLHGDAQNGAQITAVKRDDSSSGSCPKARKKKAPR